MNEIILMVSQLRRKVKEWRDSGYFGATDTSTVENVLEVLGV